MINTYDTNRSFDWNYENGPVYQGPFPDVPKTPAKDFLGLTVNSRLGIAAGLLLNSNWIEMYGRMGFDILTYKTVRSEYRKCQDMPNWLFINHDNQIDPSKLDEKQQLAAQQPADYRTMTGSVSFGMPSKAPDTWMPDVARARKALNPGQVLIVSIAASPKPDSDVQEMIADYGNLAAMAREAGAHIVEANLSCPNVCTAEGDIFLDADLSGKIAAAMKKGAGGIPVLLKLGHFADRDAIAHLLRAVSGKATGVVLVNGISRQVVDAQGAAAFGPDRVMSGISGRGIHAFSLENVETAIEVVAREKLDLEIVAVGGVSTKEDAASYFDAGAAAVMMGSAPMFDPTLAAGFKRAHPEW